MRYKLIYFAISAMVIVPGIISVLSWGLKPSVDFIGGAQLEVKIAPSQPSEDGKPSEGANPTPEIIQQIAEEHAEGASVQVSGDNSFLIRSKPITEETKNQILNNLKKRFPNQETTERKFETVGPTLGRELLTKTITGVLIATILIFLYVAWRFKDKMYGASAILAMFHDTFIIIGSFSLLGHFYGIEVDTLFVTAVLTTLSFSVHDTIVVYDRIRETLSKNPKLDFVTVANRAVNETLIRSLNNSLTIIFMLLTLALLGGPNIRWFVVALLIGTVAGTYSSTFTATPLVVVWYNHFRKKH